MNFFRVAMIVMLQSLVAVPAVTGPQTEMDTLREAAARAVAAWVDQKHPGMGRELAAEVGVSEETGNQIIAKMRLDQARCSVNSWQKAPDDLEVSHLRRLVGGIDHSADPTEYGAQVIQSMIDRGYSEHDLSEIALWAEDYYAACSREGERLYMQRLEEAIWAR